MSHIIIIRGGNYEATEPGDHAEITWSPPDDLSADEEAEIFKKKLRIYKKAVGMADPE